ncbi:MAG: hypothetical protein J6R48_04170, partial [Muribaculaceae bacterium]|nr:hypothetical protein [Muribaculaceae bacterium]
MKRSDFNRVIVAIAMMLIGWLHLLADDLAKTTNFFTMDQVMLTNPETDQYGNSYVNGFTYNSLVVSMSKQSGPSKPLYNNNNKQICLYATGTMTLSTTDGTMLEKVVFKIPPGNGNGQQNLASITASEGVVTLDNTAWTVTWSGSTSEVTLTVGAKSDWGTEYGKSGCFVVSVMEVTSIKHKIGISFGQTVLLDETFDNNDYNKSFPLVWDGDGLAPHSSISSIFLSASTGSYQPWWILRDSNTSPNMYYGSHSMYTEPGKSNDWMISVPVKIEEAGFVLSFDAQSYCMYMDESKQSSVSLYITDYMTDNPADLPKTPV